MAKPQKIRKKLFWIVVILAAVPAVCFFVFGIRVVDKAPWFMAGFTYLVAVFTFLLWRATKKYAETTEGLLEQSKQGVNQSRLLAEVTKELLNQSKETFKQSRIAFLANIVKDLTAYVKEQEKLKRTSIDYIFKISVAFGKIDKEIAKEVWETMQTWAEETPFGEYMKKYDDRFRKELG